MVNPAHQQRSKNQVSTSWFAGVSAPLVKHLRKFTLKLLGWYAYWITINADNTTVMVTGFLLRLSDINLSKIVLDWFMFHVFAYCIQLEATGRCTQ